MDKTFIVSKTVIGGNVTSKSTPKYKAEVKQVVFPGVAPEVTVPLNAVGTLDLERPLISGSFKQGDSLYYQDSNRNNDCTLFVTSAMGPTRYKVKRTA